MLGSIRPAWHVLVMLTAGILWLTVSGCGTTTTPPPAPPANPQTTSGATSAVLTTQPLPSGATLTTCDTTTVATPVHYLLACADGGLFLDALHWSNWNSPTTTANGTLWENDCTPNCADGHYIPYAATVTVSGLVGDRYTRMHVDASAPGGPFDYTIGPNGPR